MESNTLRSTVPESASGIGTSAFHLDHKLTPSERQQARHYLEQTRITVIAATNGLSEAQWKFKPAADRWSIAEIVEHMVLVQERVLGPITESLAEAPLAANPDWEKVDAIVIHRFTDRSVKFQAPELVHPKGLWTHEAAMDRLLKNYDRLNEYLDTATGLRHHMIEAPPLKAVTQGSYQFMDGYEWVLATGAHNHRHTKQILEVRADPRFPAN